MFTGHVPEAPGPAALEASAAGRWPRWPGWPGKRGTPVDPGTGPGASGVPGKETGQRTFWALIHAVPLLSFGPFLSFLAQEAHRMLAGKPLADTFRQACCRRRMRAGSWGRRWRWLAFTRASRPGDGRLVRSGEVERVMGVALLVAAGVLPAEAVATDGSIVSVNVLQDDGTAQVPLPAKNVKLGTTVPTLSV